MLLNNAKEIEFNLDTPEYLHHAFGRMTIECEYGHGYSVWDCFPLEVRKTMKTFGIRRNTRTGDIQVFFE